MNMNTRGLDELSSFQLKDELIRLGKAQSASQAAIHKFLNAGEWQSELDRHHTPRCVLPARAVGLAESKRVWNEAELGGIPERQGIAEVAAMLIGLKRREIGN